jgi:hypothetical protein
MTVSRKAIQDFSTTNYAYSNATVTAYTVDDGEKTSIKANLYATKTGESLLSNPLTLDAYGKFSQPVYIQDDVILTIVGLGNTPDHDTGIIQVNEFRMVDVAISSAQLLALHTTPRTLVAAPGANKAIVFESAQVFLDYNSAAYAGIASGDDLNIRYTNGSGAIAGTLETTGFLDQTADVYALIKPSAGSLILPPNAPLVASLAGAVTTGNSPLGVRVYYRVVDLSTLTSV